MTENEISQAEFNQLLLDSTVEGFWTIGMTGLITSVNKSAVRMFGYENADQLVGRNSHELVHHKRADGSHYPQAECPIYKSFQKGEAIHLEDEVLWRANGTFFHADYRCVPIRKNGQILGAVVTFIDNSDGWNARQELALERRRLEEIIALSPAGIALMRGERFVFETVNDKWRELVSEREYVGKTWQEAYPELHDSALPKVLSQVYETGEPFHARESEIRVETAPHTFENRFYNFSYFRVLDPLGRPYGVFCQCTNISQSVNDKNTLQETVANLENERELREHFVAALSHDMRSPLTAAKMSVQMIRRKAEDAPAVRTLSERATANLNRAEHMIRDLLDANRIKAGEGVPISVEAGELNAVVEEAVRDAIQLFGPRFEFKSETSEIKGYWDCSTLRRVVENLAGNAVKYGMAEKTVTIKTRTEGDCAELSVHNEGNPISPEDQKVLFKPWHRTDSATSSGAKGWGMGLALVREIVGAHRGTVRVESSPEQGTTFFVRLPLDSRVSE